MYKVFFNDKFVLLTDNYNYDALNSGVLFFRYEDFEELNFVVELLEQSELVEAAVIYSKDIETLWADFRTHFQEIDAGGGLVVNPDNDLLFIHRNGMWDLPKGKLESNEHAEQGALREVEEECGITDLKLGQKITTSYHVYRHKERRVLKRTFWYKMESSQTHFTPQADEGIDIVEWVPTENLNWVDRKTYASIKSVIISFLETTSQL